MKKRQIILKKTKKMTVKIFKSVSALQSQLKRDVLESIKGEITETCVNVVREQIMERVYRAYIPNGENSYDRTFELLDSVTVGNFKMGTKYAEFEIFMDTGKINPYVQEGDNWNQHASVNPIDVSEMIPLWIEEGTEGSLFDRQGAHYMEESKIDLDSKIHRALAKALRSKGWDVRVI